MQKSTRSKKQEAKAALVSPRAAGNEAATNVDVEVSTRASEVNLDIGKATVTTSEFQFATEALGNIEGFKNLLGQNCFDKIRVIPGFQRAEAARISGILLELDAGWLLPFCPRLV